MYVKVRGTFFNSFYIALNKDKNIPTKPTKSLKTL